MHEKLIIDNGELFIRDFNEDGKEEDHKISEDKLKHALMCPVSIANTTFGQFMNLFRKDSEFFETALGGAFGHFPMKPFLDEMDKDPEEEEKDYKFTGIELSWLTDEDLDGDMTIVGDGHINSDDEECDRFAMDGVALNQMKDLPLSLNEKIAFYDDGDAFFAGKAILEKTKKFTLADVFITIMYEISFYGIPEKRDKIFGELRERELASMAKLDDEKGNDEKS